MIAGLILIGEKEKVDFQRFKNKLEKINCIIPGDKVFIIVDEKWYLDNSSQINFISMENIIIEPLYRGSAVSIGRGVQYIEEKLGSVLVVIYSHEIELTDVETLTRVINEGIKIAQNDKLVNINLNKLSNIYVTTSKRVLYEIKKYFNTMPRNLSSLNKLDFSEYYSLPIIDFENIVLRRLNIHYILTLKEERREIEEAVNM